jgi:hypothetical protein
MESLPSSSREGIGDLEEIKSSEVPIDSIEPPDAMLAKESGEVGIRNLIPPDRQVGGHLPIDFEEALVFREDAQAR